MFSKIKQKFKTMRSECLVRYKRPNIHTLIHRAVKTLKKEEIVRCIQHTNRIMDA